MSSRREVGWNYNSHAMYSAVEFALSSDWLLLQLSLSTVERQFICACSVNLTWLMPETAGMHLCRFVSKEMKEHRTKNNNGLSVWNNLSWDNLSCHLFLCNLDGGVKVLKLLCGVCGRKWSSKSKRLCKRLRVLSSDCIIIILKLLNSNNTSNNGFILHFHKVALHLWNTSP